MHTRMETQSDQILEWFKDMEREFQLHIPADTALAIGATHNLSLKDRLIIVLKNVHDVSALNQHISDLEEQIEELEQGPDDDDDDDECAPGCENCKKLQERLDAIEEIVR